MSGSTLKNKTRNEWAKWGNFQKVAGKFNFLHMDYEASDAVRNWKMLGRRKNINLR